LNDLSGEYSFIDNKLKFKDHEKTLLEKIEEGPRIARTFINRRDLPTIAPVFHLFKVCAIGVISCWESVGVVGPSVPVETNNGVRPGAVERCKEAQTDPELP
jgi:hypothetical protein